ncbi:MAG TPA: TIGR02391 family protein [Streptosporangiales bacterium]
MGRGNASDRLGAAKALWRDGHFRNAVSSAAEALGVSVKHRVGRKDIADTSLWRETFSSDDPKSGKPRLRWPADATDLTVKSINEGLRSFAPGVQMTIRNSATHQLDDLDEQAALERLATLSLLARWLDECDLVEAPAEGQPPV